MVIQMQHKSNYSGVLCLSRFSLKGSDREGKEKEDDGLGEAEP